jgi:hypothetical protein
LEREFGGHASCLRDVDLERCFVDRASCLRNVVFGAFDVERPCVVSLLAWLRACSQGSDCGSDCGYVSREEAFVVNKWDGVALSSECHGYRIVGLVFEAECMASRERRRSHNLLEIEGVRWGVAGVRQHTSESGRKMDFWFVIITVRQDCAIYLHRMYEFLFASFAPIVQTVVCTAAWSAYFQH